MMSHGAQAWFLLLSEFQFMFTAPSYPIFVQMATGWAGPANAPTRYIRG